MKGFLFILCFALCRCGIGAESSLNVSALHGEEIRQWHAWKSLYGKKYDSKDEEQARLQIWVENMKKILAHNLEGLPYKMRMNRFGDLTTAEYRDRYLRYSQVTDASQVEPPQHHKNQTLPKEVDWRKAGVVTPVENQGPLGASWAFSATGSLESQHAIKNGTLVALSQRNLVDCCKCWSVGGAFTYVMKNGGIDTAAGYPSQKPIGECHFDPKYIGATCTGYHNLPRGKEWDLQVAVANVGPVSVYIDASHASFQLYSSGVYNEPDCSTPPLLNHAMVVVGYGVYDGQDYWLVKNSWGIEWGMKGYIMMSRNKHNQCGIASMAIYPDVPGFKR